jgi:PadR family transcriptional regulator, regulatory protein AphA
VSDESLPTTSYAVLGLLSMRPMSGYELASHADRSIANFWPIPRSQLYRELPRLAELGLVAAETVEQTTAPNKRVYEITATGREALRTWVDADDIPGERRKNGMLVKVYLARFGSPGTLSRLLADHRRQVEQNLADLRAIVEHLTPRPEARYGRLTARYGVLAAEAQLAWLDEAEEFAAQERSREATAQESPR